MRILLELLQIRRLFRPAALWFREDKLSCVRLQYSEHLVILLVRHGTEDNPDTLRVGFLQETGQRARSLNVMRAIQQKLSDSFETSGPRRGVDTTYDVLAIHA